MQSIIEELANGNINPVEQSFKRGSEYAKALNLVCEKEEVLINAVGKEYKPLVDAFTSAQGQLSSLSGKDKFAYGYKLGIHTIVEVFTTADQLTSGVIE